MKRRKHSWKILICVLTLVLSSNLNVGCNLTKKNLSKGTPSVPQGPAITIQEEHNIREANKFNRFTEHMTKTRREDIKLEILSFDTGSTKDYLTEIAVSIKLENITSDSIYVYDLIFEGLKANNIVPAQRIIIDNKTDHFLIGPGAKKVVGLNLQLPWFEDPEPGRLMKEGNTLMIGIVLSKEKVNVDEFFKEASDSMNFDSLPETLKVFSLIAKEYPIPVR